MSREVDERIVEMRFDNAQFESGVSKTLKTLDKLNESLKFEGVSKAISGVQDAVQRIDMNPLVQGIEKVANSYTTLTGRIKMEVFDRLANMAVDTGEKIFQALTFGGAKAGMAEYETQQGAVQTILANTQHLGTTINDVVAALDDLNDYADLTIYNFTQMTRNIGTFTAAGLDLETSTSAIKGIANLAAISGSTSEQASRAMYQLSQALAAGRVNLQDWNSVVNAGMGGKVFQDALKKTAKHMGIVVDETTSFRESISGGDTWLSAEVLSETLKQLSGDMTDAELAAQGWSESEIKEIQDMAKTAIDAATVVKTFSQLMDTVSEQIGSGWTRTWQLIFGDFEESKALWTSVYEAISPYIEAFSDLRNNHLKFWKENEGRTKVLQAFSNLWQAASTTFDSFAAAMKKAFPIFDNFGQTLVDLSDKFLKFSERFTGIKNTAEDVSKAATKMVSRISDAEKEAANAIWYEGKYGNGEDRVRNLEAEGLSYRNVQDYLEALIETDFDAEKANERFMESVEDTTKAVDNLVDSNRTLTPIENVAKILSNAAYVFKSFAQDAAKIGGAIFSAFKKVFSISDTLDKVGTISDKFKSLVESLRVTDSALSKIERIASGVFSVFKMLGQAVLGVGSAVLDIFNKLSPTTNELGGNLLESAASLADLITKFAETHDISEIVHDAIMKVVEVMGNIPNMFDDAKKAVSDFFDNISNKIKGVTGIDFAKIGGIFKAFGEMIADAFSGLNDKLASLTHIDIGGGFSAFITKLKDAVTNIFSLDFKGAFNSITESFSGFKVSITDSVNNTKPESIFGKFIENMTKVKEKIAEVFSGLFTGSSFKKKKTGVGSGGKTVAQDVQQQASTFTTIGDILGKAASFLLKKTKDIAKSLAKAIPEAFKTLKDAIFEGTDEGSAMDKVKKFLDNIKTILSDFWKIIGPFIGVKWVGDIKSAATGVGKALKTLIENVAKMPDVLSKSIDRVGKSFENMTKAYKTSIDVKFIKELAKAILIIAAAVLIFSFIDYTHLSVAVGAMTFVIGELMGSIAIMQKYFKADIDYVFISKAMSKLANAVLMISFAISMMAKRDPMKLGVAVGAITVVIAALVGAMVVIQKALKEDFNPSKTVNAIIALAFAMNIIAGAIALLSFFNPKKLLTATVSLVLILTALTGAVLAIQKMSGETQATDIKQLTALASIAYAISGSILTLVRAVTRLTKSAGNAGDMITATGLVGALMLLLVAVIKLISEIKIDKTATGTIIAMFAAVIAVKMLANAAAKLGKVGNDKILAATAGIFAMIGALATLIGLMILISKISSPAQIWAASGATMAAVLAIQGLVPAMLLLGTMELGKVGSALLALGGSLAILVGVIALLSTMGSGNVLAISGSMMLFGLALTFMIPPILAFGNFIVPLLKELVSVDIKKIGKGFLIFAGALVMMAVAAPVLALLGSGLSIFGLGLGVVALSITEAAKGFDILVNALTKLAAIWPIIKNVITDFGTQLGKGLSSFMSGFIDGLDEVLTKLRKLAPDIAETVKTLIVSVADTIFGWAPAVAKYFLDFFIQSLTMFYNDLPLILNVITLIINTILTWLGENAYTWTEKLVEILMDVLTGIFDGLTAKIDQLVESVFNFMVAFLKAIADAIENHGGDLLVQAIRIIGNILELLWKAVKGYWKWMMRIGGDVIDYIVQGLEEHGGNIIDKIVGFFKDDVPREVKKAWNAIEELGKTIVDKILGGIGKKWKEAKDTMAQFGDDMLAAFKAVLGIHSDSDEMEDCADYTIGGYVHELGREGYQVEDAMAQLGENGGDAFRSSIFDQVEGEDYSFNPEFDVNPNVNMDVDKLSGDVTKQMEEAGSNVSMDSLFSNIKPADENLQSLNWAAIMNQYKPTSQDDFQATMDDQSALKTTSTLADNIASNNSLFGSSNVLQTKSNELTEKLNGNMEKLVDSFKNGMINIPDNATFSTSINLDGRTIADATAPYLDVLNADRVADAERGVATR